MGENQELIIVEQLPVIKEQLKNVSKEIDKEVANAKSLVCTEENIKTVKDVRAKLNNTFKALEEQRKNVKKSVMQPYENFEKIYKECVTDKFKDADADLKSKIDAIETEEKNKKENEIREFFEEYKKANNIDFIKYEQANINITLSASIKSLKEQAKAFINQRIDDLNLIETQEHKEEILVEYKQSLNVSQAITAVTNRFKAIEEEKKKQEEMKQKELQQQEKFSHEEIEQELNHASEILEEPTEEKQEQTEKIPEEILTLSFTVRGTRTKLKELKIFLDNGGFDYE